MCEIAESSDWVSPDEREKDRVVTSRGVDSSPLSHRFIDRKDRYPKGQKAELISKKKRKCFTHDDIPGVFVSADVGILEDQRTLEVP